MNLVCLLIFSSIEGLITAVENCGSKGCMVINLGKTICLWFL
jgi:hypothetical protein